MNPEILRIKNVYSSNDFIPQGENTWSYFNPAYLFHVQKRDRNIIQMLYRYGLTPLSDKKILDIGCGTGRELGKMGFYGAKPGNLYGVDLISKRVGMAKIMNPSAHFQIANAEHLPFPDESFDLIMQFTCFSSVLDFDTKKNIADEIRRVLKPQGIFLWFDMGPVPLPVKVINGIGKYILEKRKKRPGTGYEGETDGDSHSRLAPPSLREIRKLFQNCSICPKRVSLYFPWGKVAGASWALASFLESFPFFRTHWLIVIQKKG